VATGGRLDAFRAVRSGRASTASSRAASGQSAAAAAFSSCAASAAASGRPDAAGHSGHEGAGQEDDGSEGDIRFVATEAGSTFRCRLDGRRWRSCRSPRTYLRLARGLHTFRVRAIDRAGNVDPTPAKRSWQIR
jgi:hypothetical protein